MLERRVDSLFSREIRPDAPGCAVGVYRNGEVVMTRGYGLASVEDRRPITARTAFNIGSASKPFALDAHAERDMFIRGFGAWVNTLNARLEFHRNRGGELTHFTVSTPPGEDSVRGLRFVRVGSS